MTDTATTTTAAAKYEIVEIVGARRGMLRLFDAYAAQSSALEFGCVNAVSGVMCARHEGKVYVGHNPMNPASFDATTGECIEAHITGITMASVLALLAARGNIVPNKKRPYLTLTPSEGWNAWFRLLAPPQYDREALRFRVYVTSPYQDDVLFEDEYTMHELLM
jgi:hypothetical protein